jgi:hypothetical protein
MIVVVVMPTIMVAIMVMVPVVVMLEAAARAVPISDVELSAFVTRADPVSSRVGWASPIAAVPNVAATYGIPVAINPDIFWPRLHGTHVHHTRWRRLPNPNTDALLPERFWRAAD